MCGQWKYNRKKKGFTFNPVPLLLTMMRFGNTSSMNIAPDDLYSETELIPQQMLTESPLHRLSYVLGAKQQRQGHLLIFNQANTFNQF